MFSKIILASCFFIPMVLMAQDTVKVGAGATLHLTGGVLVTLENMHFDNDGIVNLANGDGIFRFSGNTTTHILGGSMPLFDNIAIAKSGGAELRLQRDIRLVSGVNFTSGVVNLNNNNILLQPTALLTGESEASHITGTNGGYVEINRTLNAPAAENPGNLGATFTSSQDFGSTTIRRGHVAHVIGTSNSVNRYFDITPTNNTGLNAALRFQYLVAELNGLNEKTLSLWKSQNNINWDSVGYDNRSLLTNYVEKSGIAGFSRWTLNAPSFTLPVTFISIHARCENGKVILAWKTARQMNSSRFDIERSVDGTNWTVAGSVPAAGNSQSQQAYTFTDMNSLPSVTNYRIVEHDIDGRKQYTSIVRSSCDADEEIKLWPNPVHDIARLNISTNSNSTVLIQVYDSKGSLVLIQKANLSQGNNQLNIPVEKLTPGIYHLKVDYQRGSTKTFRLAKQ